MDRDKAMKRAVKSKHLALLRLDAIEAKLVFYRRRKREEHAKLRRAQERIRDLATGAERG